MTSGFSKTLFWILVIGNVIGAIFGFTYWYGSQLLASSVLYWIFIATCPLYSALFVVCAFMILFKKKNSFLFYLTAVGLVKFGLWTVIFWMNYTGTPIANWLFLWLIFSHGFMALESMILYSRIEFKPWYIIFAWLWFGFNDYVSYGLGFMTNKVAIASKEMYVAVVLTAVIPLLVYWLVKYFRYKNLKVLI